MLLNSSVFWSNQSPFSYSFGSISKFLNTLPDLVWSMEFNLFLVSSSNLKEETLINKDRYDGKLISYDEFLKNDYDAIVDGLLGANLSVQINEKTKAIINAINDKKSRVFSIDIASGIDASSGKNLGAFVHSFLTVAIEAFKIGHFFFDGKNSYEKLSLVSANVELIHKENYLNFSKLI